MGNNKAGTVIDNESKKPLHLVTKSQFLRESREKEVVVCIGCLGWVSQHASWDSSSSQFISDFNDIMPAELPDELPPLLDIQHAIDFVPDSSLPNLLHYKWTPLSTQSWGGRRMSCCGRALLEGLSSVSHLHYSHQKKIAAGGCVYIVMPSIGSLSSIGSPSLDLMTY